MRTTEDELYVRRVRAHESVAGQVVSLLELPGLMPTDHGAKRRLAALWKCQVTTADELERAIPEELAERLCTFRGFPARCEHIRPWIREWKVHIDRLRCAREAGVLSEDGWDKTEG